MGTVELTYEGVGEQVYIVRECDRYCAAAVRKHKDHHAMRAHVAVHLLLSDSTSCSRLSEGKRKQWLVSCIMPVESLVNLA